MKLTIINEENNSKLTLNANEEMINQIESNKNLKIEKNENETLITTNSFNIQCLLFGHAWYNNVCVRCGATR